MSKPRLLLFVFTSMLLIAAGCTAAPAADMPAPSATLPSPQVQVTPAQAQPEPQPSPTTQPEDPSPPAEAAMPSTAEPTALPESPAVPPKDCINKAAFYNDITIPDGTPFNPGRPFTKTWRVRNEGTCPWTEDYAVIFDYGDLMNAALVNPMPPAQPGEIIDISVEMTSPALAGAYQGFWQFRADDGQTFGLGYDGNGLLWVKIGVRSAGGGQTTQTTSSSCSYEQNSDFEAQLLNLINTARSQQGLKALSLNSQLSQAALRHSADMACQDFVGHNGSDSSTWYTRVTDTGLAYTSASENIYVGDPAFGGTTQGAFDWWMNSQIHRDNILDAAFTKIGIGYVYRPGSSYGGYFTLVFSRP